MNYELREVDRGAGAICRSILASLPTWFGIPSAVDDYVTTADTHGSLIAAVDGLDIGITTLVHHSPDAAEVHLMAVMPTTIGAVSAERCSAALRSRLPISGSRSCK